MAECLFVTDLHGSASRVAALAREIVEHRPDAVFVGGDLLPPFGGTVAGPERFVVDVFAASLDAVRRALGKRYPAVFVIFGNDDPRAAEPLVSTGRDGLWLYVHGRSAAWREWRVFGYAYVPPTPFHLKDWERYDVSRYVDPGALSPEEGARTVVVDPRSERFATIAADLAALAPDGALDDAIWLFHAPPYDTALDRAAVDGRMIDHVPVDVHVGSIAIRRFIERRQPAVTLHGHVHESTRLTGCWLERLGRTAMLSAAHDGPELAVVRFDPRAPSRACRTLVSV